MNDEEHDNYLKILDGMDSRHILKDIALEFREIKLLLIEILDKLNDKEQNAKNDTNTQH